MTVPGDFYRPPTGTISWPPSTDAGVPLVSHAYPGDRPDVTQFPLMLQELNARFTALTGAGEGEGGAAPALTLVFDAGQNSAANCALLEDSPWSFVGSVAPSDHPELLAVPRTRYRIVDRARFPGLTAFETTKVIFGTERACQGFCVRSPEGVRG